MKEVIEGIRNADSTELDVFAAEMKRRKETLNLQKAASLKVGQRVRFTDVRPKYLIGSFATVVEVTPGKKTVGLRLEESVGKFSNDYPISAKPGMFELVGGTT